LTRNSEKIQLPKSKRNQPGHESDPRMLETAEIAVLRKSTICNVVNKKKLVEEKLLPPQVRCVN